MTRPLGRGGLTVGPHAFGSAPIGNLGREVSDEEWQGALSAAWDAGIRYFDTAPHYGLGLAERRLATALEDASVAGPERKDVARPHEVVGALARIDCDLDGAGAVVRGDAGRDPFTGLDRDGERGSERRLVALGHLLQAELIATLLG